MDSYAGYRERGMSWTARIFLVILVLLIFAAVALGIYAGTLKPPHHTYTFVVPNSRFQS